MKPLQLSLYVADLLLVSEGSEESVREPKVRIVWHTFFFSLLIFAALTTLFNMVIKSHMEHSELAAIIYRAFYSVCLGYFIALLYLLAYRHYIYLLKTGRDLRFQQIIFFYIFGVLLFAKLYGSLFFLQPNLFTYSHPIIEPTACLMEFSLLIYALLADFFVYSACVTVSIEYPRIMSSSLLVSALNVMQILFSLTIVAIFIATFIQKADQKEIK